MTDNTAAATANDSDSDCVRRGPMRRRLRRWRDAVDGAVDAEGSDRVRGDDVFADTQRDAKNTDDGEDRRRNVARGVRYDVNEDETRDVV